MTGFKNVLFSIFISQMYYHTYNNLSELLDWELTTNIWRWIHSRGLMDRACNFSDPSKVDFKCVYEGNFWEMCLIWWLKCTYCGTIYIRNTQQTFRKIMYGHFSDVLRIIKKEKNQTHYLPITGSNFDPLHPALTYASVLCSKWLSSSTPLEKWIHSLK